MRWYVATGEILLDPFEEVDVNRHEIFGSAVLRAVFNHPDLAVSEERHAPVAGYGRSMAIAKLLGGTAIEGDDVDGLLGSLRQISRIGNIAVGVEIAAAGVNQEAAVSAPGNLA